MTQALYTHMNNKKKLKKERIFLLEMEIKTKMSYLLTAVKWTKNDNR
jgi:hypothetical protein